MRVHIQLGRFLPFAMMEALEMRKHFAATPIHFSPIIGVPIDGDETPPPDSVQMNYDQSVSEAATVASHVVGTWAQFSGPLAASQYTATIDWGDGTSSGGNIVARQDGSYAVVGDHDYGAKGQFEISVEVDATDGSQGFDWHELYTKADPITFTTNADLWDSTADDGDIYLADFVTTEPARLEDYTASVNWGDGSVSDAKIVDNGNGSYGVVGTHAYASTGQYVVSLTVRNGASQESTAGTASIDDDPILWTLDGSANDADSTLPGDETNGGDEGSEEILHPIFVRTTPIFMTERGVTDGSTSSGDKTTAPPPPPTSVGPPPPQFKLAYDMSGDVDPAHLLS